MVVSPQHGLRTLPSVSPQAFSTIPGRGLCRVRSQDSIPSPRSNQFALPFSWGFLIDRAPLSEGTRHSRISGQPGNPCLPPTYLLLERLKEGQELVIRSITARPSTGRNGFRQGFLLQRQVGIEINLRCLDRLMPQPKGDKRSIDTGL